MHTPIQLVGRGVALLGWIGRLRSIALGRIGLRRVGLLCRVGLLWRVPQISWVGRRVVLLHLSWVGLLGKAGKKNIQRMYYGVHKPGTPCQNVH